MPRPPQYGINRRRQSEAPEPREQISNPTNPVKTSTAGEMVEVRGKASNRNHAGRVGVAAARKRKMVEPSGIEPLTS
jgi:hypothetical protein